MFCWLNPYDTLLVGLKIAILLRSAFTNIESYQWDTDSVHLTSKVLKIIKPLNH